MFASIWLERRLKESKMGLGCWGSRTSPTQPSLVLRRYLTRKKKWSQGCDLNEAVSKKGEIKRSQHFHPHSLLSVGTSWRWKASSPRCSRPYSKSPPAPGLKALRSVVPLITLLTKRKTFPISPSSEFSKRAKDTLGVQKQTHFKKLDTVLWHKDNALIVCLRLPCYVKTML